jgi:hypothetical protein
MNEPKPNEKTHKRARLADSGPTEIGKDLFLNPICEPF